MQVFLKDANGSLYPIERGSDEAQWLVEGIDNVDSKSRSSHENPTYYYGLVIDGKPTPLPLAVSFHDQVKAFYVS